VVIPTILRRTVPRLRNLAKEEKKKSDKRKEKAAKVSATMATVDIVPEPIFSGPIILEDGLNFEVNELDMQ